MRRIGSRITRGTLLVVTVTAITGLAGGYVGYVAQHGVVKNKEVLSPTAPQAPQAQLPDTIQLVGGNLEVKGSFQADDISSSGIVITPSSSSPVKGQLYVTTGDQLHFYDGQRSVNLSSVDSLSNDLRDIKSELDKLAARPAGVISLQGQSGNLTLTGSDGIAIAGTSVRNTGVLSLQGRAGNVTLSGGSGIEVIGTTITNKGVTDVAGARGSISLGQGLAVSNGTLLNTGITQLVSGSNNIVVTNNGGGVYTISETGAGTSGTVALAPGTAQDDDSSSSSIWINKTTGTGNLLQLSTGASQVDRFVVDASGAILSGTIDFGQVTGKPDFVNSLGGATGDLLVGPGLMLTGQTLANAGVVDIGGLSGTVALGSGLTVQGGQLVATGIGGSGTAGTIAVFTGTGLVGNSMLSQNGTGDTLTIDGAVVAASLQGNGAALTDVDAIALQGHDTSYFTNASNLGTGTVADARLSSDVTLQGNIFNGVNQLVQLTASGGLPTLDGSLLTSLSAANLTGTVADARLSNNVSLFGSSVESAEIVDGTIAAADLSMVNTAVAGYLMAYDAVSGGFTYVDPTTVGPDDVRSLNGLSGIISLASSSTDLTVATDAGTGTITVALEPNVASYADADAIFAGNLRTNGDARVDNDLSVYGLTNLNNNVTVVGDLSLQGNVTVAANKTINMVGGLTSMRPASPNEGTIYFDSETDELLVFAGGSWQPLNGAGADGKTATKIVAASNSPQAIKDAADYVADGTADQAEINAALTVAAGGVVYLAEGTYVANATILVPNNTTLAGAGNGTVIELADLDADENLIENSDTGAGTGVAVRDLVLKGRKDLNTAGIQVGVNIDGTFGAKNARIEGVTIDGFRSGGIRVDGFDNSHILRNVLRNSGQHAIEIIYQNASVVSSNVITSSGGSGIMLTGAEDSVFSDNTIIDSGQYGIASNGGGASDNLIADNVIEGSDSYGLSIASSNGFIVQGNVIKQGSSIGLHINSGYITVTGNYIESNAREGVNITYSSNVTIGNNIIANNGRDAVRVNESNEVVVDANNIYEYGSTGAYHGIEISGTDTNRNKGISVRGNNIKDSSGTGYAINISGTAAQAVYLADNTLGGGTINDLGTGTIYGGQVSASGNFQIQPAGTIELMKATNVTGNLAVAGSGSFTGTVSGADAVNNNEFVTLGQLNTALSGVGGGGVTTVGALDGGTANASGATIAGDTLYLQSANATNPGLVTTGAQTFAGDKTFQGSTQIEGSLWVSDVMDSYNRLHRTQIIAAGSNPALTATSNTATSLLVQGGGGQNASPTMIVKSDGSQTGDLLQIQAGNGTAIAGFKNDGSLFAQQGQINGDLSVVDTFTTDTLLQVDTLNRMVKTTSLVVQSTEDDGLPVLIAKGTTGQVNDLFQVQNAAGSELFTVTYDGNVGIGVASPSQKLSVGGAGSFTGALTASSTLTVQGNATLNGNTTLGNASTDTITLSGRVGSHILPSVDDTYDLGSSTDRWRDLYLGPNSLHIGQSGNEATLGYDSATGDILFRVNGQTKLSVGTANGMAMSGDTGTLALSALTNPSSSSAFGSLDFKSYDTQTSAWSLAYDGTVEPASPYFRGFYSLMYDPASNAMYAGTDGGYIYRCDATTDCDTTGEWAPVFDAPSNGGDVTQLALDTVNGTIFARQLGDIIYCDTASGCDQQVDWVTYTMTYATSLDTFEASTGKLYGYRYNTATSKAEVMACDTTSGCNASSDWVAYDTPVSTADGQYITGVAADSANGTLYISTKDTNLWEGKIYRCATAGDCSVSSNWLQAFSVSEYVVGIYYDDTTQALYATNEYGGFYRCATTSGCDVQGEWIYKWLATASSWVIDIVTEPVSGRTLFLTENEIFTCASSTGCDDNSELTLDYAVPNSINHAIATDDAGVLYVGGNNDSAGGYENYIYRNGGSYVPQLTNYAQMQAIAINSTNTSEAGALLFNTMNSGALTEGMRLQGGKLGIGDNNPTYKLDVTDNQASNYVMRIKNSSTANTADGLLIDLGVAAASRGTGNYFAAFASAGTVAGKIQGGASAVAYTTSGADYAEYFKADPSDLPQAGELVTLDPTRPNGVRRAQAGDMLAGIISTSPGFIGNGPICDVDDEDCDTNYQKSNVLVSLTGQVPLKTNSEGGAIQVGTPLGASGAAGVATKVTSGHIVGYALTEPDESGLVQVLVRPQALQVAVQGADAAFTSLVLSGNLTVGGDLAVTGTTRLADLYVDGKLVVGGHIAFEAAAPTIKAGARLGAAEGASELAKVEVDGTDTAGTATLVAGSGATVGELAAITFADPYETTPRIVISAASQEALELGIYIEKTDTGFRLVSTHAPEAGKVYRYDYIVIGARSTP